MTLDNNQLREKLNLYKKGKYGKSHFPIYFHLYPKWSYSEITLENISTNRNENNEERKIIGELAARITFYAYGFKKIPTSD